MVKVLVGGTGIPREEVIVDENTTSLRDVLDGKSIDYSVGSTFIDGVALKADEMDKTFAAMNKTTRCSLMVIVKGDAATA